MIELTIDGKKVQVRDGMTVMEAAAQAGITIPSMCHNGSLPHFASCMVCLVRNGSGRLITSCSVQATEGMNIITSDDEIREARKTALDLLLSDHTGDCDAPCQLSCPAHLDIPLMNRQLAAGEFGQAFETVMRDIPIPSILGRICPAPCENACRRKPIDGAVSICLLKRFAGDQGLETKDNSHLSRVTRHASRVTKQIAIIGSGPHGLSAAWYLQQWGYGCTVFDRNPLPGGSLRYSVPRDLLPEEVLNREIERIRNSGVRFVMNTDLETSDLDKMKQEYAALIEPPGKPPKMAIKASAMGKEAALRVHQMLTGQEVTGEKHRFNSRFGRLLPGEVVEYLKESYPADRVLPSGGIIEGFTPEEVMAEAARCLHCDCRKKDNCGLRDLSDEYQADQKRFSNPDRQPVTKLIHHELIIYEPAKCIKCGICVRITSEQKEELGLTFIGRGFDVVIGVPFTESLKNGLRHTARRVAEECPTGAMCFKEKG